MACSFVCNGFCWAFSAILEVVVFLGLFAGHFQNIIMLNSFCTAYFVGMSAFDRKLFRIMEKNRWSCPCTWIIVHVMTTSNTNFVSFHHFQTKQQDELRKWIYVDWKNIPTYTYNNVLLITIVENNNFLEQ